jgi:hypothetical protein
MRNLVLTLCILLVPMAAIAQEPCKAQESLDRTATPAMTQESAVLLSLILKEEGGPVLEMEGGRFDIPTWCSNRNNNYCTYGWNWMTRCCYPTYTQPGALCETICE